MRPLMKTGTSLAAIGLALALAVPAVLADAGGDCPCPRMGGMGGPAMMEGMKKHMEEMGTATAALRESEKKLDAATDTKDFRAAVIAHLKRLDDLQASHLAHMESMMKGRHGGHGEGMHGATGGGCRCGGHDGCGCSGHHGCGCPGRGWSGDCGCPCGAGHGH